MNTICPDKDKMLMFSMNHIYEFILLMFALVSMRPLVKMMWHKI